MATDKLKLYNGALRLCEERRLASLSENREPRRLLDDVWGDDPIKLWLEQANWQFAARTYKLTYDPDFSAEFGYEYAFEKPDDYVRTIAISSNDSMLPALTDFRDEGNYWYSHFDTIYVTIVSDDEDYGRDMSKWPESFVRFGQADLAVEINPRLSGSSTSTEELMRVRKQRLSDAMGKDGANRPTLFPSPGTWSRARAGGRLNRERR